MNQTNIICRQTGLLNKDECSNLLLDTDNYITFLDLAKKDGLHLDKIITSLTTYINNLMLGSEALKLTIGGNYFINSMFIEKHSNTNFKQLVNVNYECKNYNYVIGILMLDNLGTKSKVTIGSHEYELENGDIIWFPASWCYPFCENYCENTHSLKIIINKFM